MFEDLAEVVFSPWGLGALAVIGASRTDEGRRIFRSAVKEVVRAGCRVAAVGSELFTKACDEADKFLSEVEAERAQKGPSLIKMRRHDSHE